MKKKLAKKEYIFKGLEKVEIDKVDEDDIQDLVAFANTSSRTACVTSSCDACACSLARCGYC